MSEASASSGLWADVCTLPCCRSGLERLLVGSLLQRGLYRHLTALAFWKSSQELASLGYLEDVFLLAKDAPQRPTCEAGPGVWGGLGKLRSALRSAQAGPGPGQVVAFRAFLNARGHPQAKAGPGRKIQGTGALPNRPCPGRGIAMIGRASFMDLEINTLGSQSSRSSFAVSHCAGSWDGCLWFVQRSCKTSASSVAGVFKCIL